MGTIKLKKEHSARDWVKKVVDTGGEMVRVHYVGNGGTEYIAKKDIENINAPIEDIPAKKS